MKSWNQLFIRQGFLLTEVQEGHFRCDEESKENMEFLLEALGELEVDYSYVESELVLFDEPVTEEKWLSVLDFRGRGRIGFIGTILLVRNFDMYISGLVRQFNRIGLKTSHSCDGHDTGRPHIGFENDSDVRKAQRIIQLIGNVKVDRRYSGIIIHANRTRLLDLCEILHGFTAEELSKSDDSIRRKLFQLRLEGFLSIPGVSGEEDQIRDFVKKELTPWVDQLTTDSYGNLLGRKVFKHGNGPTILLNAHLDTAEDFCEGRTIVKHGSTWSSSEGILGADDRAGLTVLVETLRRLTTSSFGGTVIVICSVQEEVGLIGARNVDETFLWGIDAAFVLDRRGGGDIVTSCGGYEPFCHLAFGEWVEDIGRKYSHGEWRCTNGGSSDARIWASHGIQTVNLSVGYQWEHTDDEQLDVDACYETVNVMMGVFEEARSLRGVLREVRRPRRRTPAS
ncbi:M28 family peptidase [Halobacillus yeomjeoni]|uniref:M28 family peptidase n=1 Tax=Halobacillus yeomjeoni TaxID=311194 RepID=UPI001CD20B36|nr:M28 family peptidase [Halobacillus yeomjeoni]MCA0984291.1 M28 family peptidase [Halobacillus yeomjeoni]